MVRITYVARTEGVVVGPAHQADAPADVPRVVGADLGDVRGEPT